MPAVITPANDSDHDGENPMPMIAIGRPHPGTGVRRDGTDDEAQHERCRISGTHRKPAPQPPGKEHDDRRKRHRRYDNIRKCRRHDPRGWPHIHEKT
jgi:hypothetical protein